MVSKYLISGVFLTLSRLVPPVHVTIMDLSANSGEENTCQMLTVCLILGSFLLCSSIVQRWSQGLPGATPTFARREWPNEARRRPPTSDSAPRYIPSAPGGTLVCDCMTLKTFLLTLEVRHYRLCGENPPPPEDGKTGRSSEFVGARTMPARYRT